MGRADRLAAYSNTRMNPIPLPNQSRRSFLRASLASATVLSVPTFLRAQGANGDVRVAVIGTGGRGSGHIGQYLKAKGCRLVAICDCDQKALDRHQAELKNKNVEVKTYLDFRKLLEDKDIDAVSIATPNHTHSLIAIRAVQAGKHVFVEKPVSHNIWEGRQLVTASEKYGKTIMHGMQRRSSEGWAECMEWVKGNTGLGKMTLSRGLCYKSRQSIGKSSAPTEAPSSVNYDLWSGPREIKPVNRKQFHYDWHWQWAYGSGDIGNQGPHQFDVGRWALGDPGESPTSVICVGGRFGYDDDGETPNTQIAFFDFKPVPMIFEVRGLPKAKMEFKKFQSKYMPSPKVNQGTEIGNVIHFEGGFIVEGQVYDNDGKAVRERFKVGESGDHCAHFIDSIHEGKVRKIWNAETGHLCASLPHMANTSYRIGQASKPGEIAERIKGNAQFSETYERMKQHLADNDIDLEKSNPVLGPVLTFDPKSEKFTGELADKANAIQTETYRPGFEIKI